MNTKIITSLMFIGSLGLVNVNAQEVKKDTTTTVISIFDHDEDDSRLVSITKKTNSTSQISKKRKYPRHFGGITFSRLDWGFSRIIDDGSFTMSDDNKFLSYSKASNFGFDVAQFGVRTSDNFKIYASAGFEWNYLRLKENVVLAESTTPLSYEVVDRNVTNYNKNVFTSTYLRVPLTFEWRSKGPKDRMKILFGPTTGILLKGTQRLRSDQYGKQKHKDNYNLQSFQYGGFVRVGMGNFGLFAKYYMNDFFENSPQQEGLNNFTFGLTLGL